MNIQIKSLENAAKGSKALPKQFDEPIREDIIKRAVLAIQSNARQPYGSDPDAGMKVSAKVSRRRRDYRGSYGIGISRVPRKVMSRRGTRMNWVGALAPGTVGGRRAHPPKAGKEWSKKINKKENRLAIRSAMGATMHPEIVKARGHVVPKEYPFIIENGFEKISKTAEARKVLVALGFDAELERSSIVRIKTGRARTRGRGSKVPVGVLVVVSAESPVMKALANIPGVDCAVVNALNAELLAPGTHPGRATLFTESAIQRISDEGLFLSKKTTGEKASVKSAVDSIVARAMAQSATMTAAKTSPKKAPVEKRTATQKTTRSKKE